MGTIHENLDPSAIEDLGLWSELDVEESAPGLPIEFDDGCFTHG
jgi:hypothetical protein